MQIRNCNAGWRGTFQISHAGDLRLEWEKSQVGGFGTGEGVSEGDGERGAGGRGGTN